MEYFNRNSLCSGFWGPHAVNDIRSHLQYGTPVTTGTPTERRPVRGTTFREQMVLTITRPTGRRNRHSCRFLHRRKTYPERNFSIANGFNHITVGRTPESAFMPFFTWAENLSGTLLFDSKWFQPYHGRPDAGIGIHAVFHIGGKPIRNANFR